MTYELVKDDEVPEGVIIPDDGWALKINDIIVGVNAIKFADYPNDDGSHTVHIDYDILEGEPMEGLDDIVGDSIMEMLEDAIKVRDMKEAIKEARENK